MLEDNKYLNVSNLFDALAKLVTEFVLKNNLRQEPQLITTTNFNIGIVDKEMLANIVLPNEKPLFAASNFQNNDPSFMDDDPGLTSYINQNPAGIAAKGTDSKISFINATASLDAWSLIGRNEVKGDEVLVWVNMKHNNEVKNKFEIKGKKANTKELAEQGVNTATKWMDRQILR